MIGSPDTFSHTKEEAPRGFCIKEGAPFAPSTVGPCFTENLVVRKRRLGFIPGPFTSHLKEEAKTRDSRLTLLTCRPGHDRSLGGLRGGVMGIRLGVLGKGSPFNRVRNRVVLIVLNLWVFESSQKTF